MHTVPIEPPGDFRAVLFQLDLPASALHACATTLDAAERRRAASYRYAQDRDRFVARRGSLRRHLAAMVGTEPATLRIATDAHGKPYLPDTPALTFNLSHARELALLVTAEGRAVGCDLAWRDPALACRSVARRLFAPEEVAALEALTEAPWNVGFYNCWTRKEAYLKALGVGLSLPLDAFAVTVAADEPASLLRGQAGWTLTSFEPAPGFQAAAVIAN